MVDSWTTKHNDNHDTTSIFDENIGEDRLSIQSACDVNTNNTYHTGSLAPNLELVDSPSLYDDELKASYTILIKGILMICGCNCLPIKPSYLLLNKGKPPILIVLKFVQQTSLCLSTTLN
jgi:hypothetical protein